MLSLTGKTKYKPARTAFLSSLSITAAAFAVTLFLNLTGTAISSQEIKCLRYYPEVTVLQGILKNEMLPDPDTEYKALASYWFLYLEKPVCVFAEPEEPIPVPGVEGIQRIQLAGMNDKRHLPYLHLAGKKVRVTGELMPAVRADHFTGAFLFIIGMEPAQ